MRYRQRTLCGAIIKNGQMADHMRDINEHQSDADLITKIAAKDRDAFRRLTERYMKMLFAAAYRLGVDRDQAEDIVQDTMLKIWEKADQWNPDKGAAVKTWMYRIAYNQPVDVRRKEKNTVVIEDQNLSASEQTDYAIEDRERVSHVRQAINDLPDRQREALVLCHYQGLSNAEAAEVMGSTVKGIEGLLVRARKTLHEDLKSYKGVL